MWLLLSAAYAAEPVLAVDVVGPDGGVKLMDELPLPSDRTMSSPDGKYVMRVYVAAFDGDRAVVELAAGKSKNGQPKAKVAKSFEIDPYKPHTETLVYKDQTWTVNTILGKAWDAPELPSAEPSSERYALAWDDAALLPDAPPTEPAPAPAPAKGSKKAPKAPEPVVVRERELPEGRTQPLEQASPVKILAPHGEKHLEIETVPSPGPGHCQTGGPPLESDPTRYYVGLTDIVPRVTAREVSLRLPDGTGYRVAAGVPVVAEGEGTWRVVTGGLSFLIQADKEDLAFYYKPSGRFPEGEGPMSLAPGVVGKTGVSEVSWAGPEPLPVVGLRGVKTPVATVRVPCAEVRVVPAEGALVK